MPTNEDSIVDPTGSTAAAMPGTMRLPTWVVVALVATISGGGGGAVSYGTAKAEVNALADKVDHIEQALDIAEDRIQAAQVRVAEQGRDTASTQALLQQILRRFDTLEARLNDIAATETSRRR